MHRKRFNLYKQIYKIYKYSGSEKIIIYNEVEYNGCYNTSNT